MKNSFILLHIAIFLASCSGIFGKLIQLNEVFITWYRMFLAAIIMLFIMLFNKKRLRLTGENVKIAGAGFILGLHWIFFYGSIRYANVSVGVVCFCLSGFFTALLVPLIRKIRLSVIELLLSGLTIAGILLIFHFDSSFRTGITLGVISSLLFALFTVLNEGINKVNDIRKTTTCEMLGGTIGIGVLLPVYLYFFPAGRILPQSIDFVYLFILSLVCTVSMYLLLNRAQRNVSAFTVSLSFNLEPIYAIVLAVLIFDEDRQLTTSFCIGLALIILSLLLQMLRVIIHKKQGAVNS
ncbi:MAG TPA: EamA family transporter [Porphyromonadaceae bacterium]|nr:EamA family transporter [Porphyromonadaceae bacterium]